jgi:transcriptional regulator with XRE-family HTH domain
MPAHSKLRTPGASRIRAYHPAREVLAERGLTLTSAAAHLGLTHSSLSKMLSGAAPVSDRVRSGLVELLDLPAEDLFRDNVEPQPQPAKARLLAAGYSPAGLARRIGMSRAALGFVLSGRTYPPPRLVAVLCDLLDARPEELFEPRLLAGPVSATPKDNR